MDELDARLHRIGQRHFRAKFRLRGRDRAVVDLRGITTVRRHAEELVGRRLALLNHATTAVRRLTAGSRVRRAARHRDVLPHLPGALARRQSPETLETRLW
jgi:hypothetical protein